MNDVRVQPLPLTNLLSISYGSETVFVPREHIPALIADIMQAGFVLARADSAPALPLDAAGAEHHSTHVDLVAIRGGAA